MAHYYYFGNDNSTFCGCEDYTIYKSDKVLTEKDVQETCEWLARDNQEGYSWMATQDYYEEDYDTEEDFCEAVQEAEDEFLDSVEWEWREISEEEVFDYVSDLDEVQDWVE